MMTDGLDYISVRVCRTDGKGANLLEGSGTLFEDNDLYYVLTAYHCLSKKDNKVDIDEDLSLTEISFRYKRKDVKVSILDMVDKKPESDWALISVEKPSIDWAYEGKLKLTTEINVGLTYETYPYVSEYGKMGRYFEVIPKNKEGFCHLVDNISVPRYSVVTLMKGGSGAGVMHNVDGILYCFGFLKKTLQDGIFNDIETVCVDDIIPLLSKNAYKTFTDAELLQANAEGKKQQLDYYAGQLKQSQDTASLKVVVTQLLDTTIPAMTDSLQDEQALALLQLVEINCAELFEEDANLGALFSFDYSQYYRLVQDIDKAREYSHKAFELDGTNPKYIEAEARRLWHEDNKEETHALLSKLTDDNLFRLAVWVFEAEAQQDAFMTLPEDLRQSYLFRYYLLDLFNGFGYPRWIVDGIELKEPENLSLSSLPEWIFFFTCVHCRMQGIIPLNFGSYMPPKVLQLGFDAGWRYFKLAEGTKLEKAIPMLSALYFYWGFLLKDEKDEWYKEYLKVTIQDDNEINRRFYAVMQSSMLSMMGLYDDAFKCIISTDLYPNEMIWGFVAGLAGITQNAEYLKELTEYSKQYDFIVDSLVSESLVQAASLLRYDKVGVIFECLTFKNEYEKRLLIDYNKLCSELPFSVEGYESFIDELTGILPGVAAMVIYHSGDKERALNYLKTKFEPGKGDRLEETYFKLMSEDASRQTDYYFYLKNKRDKGEQLNPLELRQYYNYSLTLLDFNEALRVIREVRENNGDDEYSFGAFIDLLGKCEPQELAKHYEEVLAYPFVMPHSVMLVYLAYATNKYLKQAAELLYVHTVQMQDDAVSNYYIDQTLRGFITGVANETDETVSEDKYVSYTIDGAHSCRRLSPNTKLGAAIMGRKKGETIDVELSGEKKSIQIDNIYNKYGYLHYSIMKSITETGGNDYLHPLKVPDLDTPEAVETFVNQLAEINKEAQESYDKATEQYSRGDNGLFALVDTSDVVSSYYKLLFSNFEIQLKPYTAYNQASYFMMYNKHRCVLDITSLLLLFEFSNMKGGVKYKERFILPRYLYYTIVNFRKYIPVLTSHDYYMAMKEGYLHRFSVDPREDVELRFEALVNWMEQNCDIVTNPAILNMIANANQNPNAVLFQYTFVEIVSLSEPHMVLTEDAYMEKLINIPFLIASTEAYMYAVEGQVRGKEFTDFLVKNHNRHVS